VDGRVSEPLLQLQVFVQKPAEAIGAHLPTLAFGGYIRTAPALANEGRAPSG
jgi:hypothetical protein